MKGNGPNAIAMVLHAQFQYFFVELAQELRARTGARIYLYCGNSEKARYMKSVAPDGVFDAILDAGILSSAIQKTALDETDVIDRAKVVESNLGVTINQIASGNRYLGRGFAMSGVYHPRSHQSANTSHLQMIHGFVSDNRILAERAYREGMYFLGSKNRF